MSDYRLSEYADRDLAEILRYTIKNWGVKQGTNYLKLLTEATNQIVKNPSLPGSKSRSDLAEGCRVFQVGKHIIFYRSRGNLIEIARILHQSMDFPQHLSEETFPK
jgi:toxin ParE1/3/4